MISYTRKTMIAFAAMILFIIAMGIYGINKIQQLNDNASQLYLHPYTVSNAVRDITIHIVSIQENMTDVASAESQEVMNKALEQINRHEQQALKQFDLILERFLGDKTEIAKARQAFMDWEAIRQQVVNLVEQKKPYEALKIVKGEGAAHVVAMNRMMESFAAYAKHKADIFYASAMESGAKSILTITLLLILMVFISIGIALFTIRQQKKTQLKTRRYIQRIKHSESKYRELLDTSPDAMVIVDKKRIIQIVNTQAVSMFGYSAEEMIGQSVEMLVPQPYVASHTGQANQYLKNPKSRPIGQGRRLYALKKDGSQIPVSISLSPVTIDGEQYVTSDIRDMTEQESIEIQFRQAQKMETIGILVGGIAHDFNNMLASITGAVFLAKRSLDAPDNKQLNLIEAQSARAAEMVRHLLAFARKGVVQKKPLSITGMLRDAGKVLQVSVTEKIQLNVDAGDKDLFVDGDEAQLQQVVMNLVNNARDALENSITPVITVALEEFAADELFLESHPSATRQRYALLSVSDNGPGIPEHVLEHIFEPFYTTKEVGKGTGLGLAMIDGTVASHEGLIEVDSLTGEGASFKIYLPLLDTTPIEEVPFQEGADRHGDGQFILLVDDEHMLRETNCAVLESIGYQVVEAGDGLQAIKEFSIHQEQIKLVLMDVVMPKMSGITAAKRIRKINPSIPIIFITGYDRSQVLGDAANEIEDCVVLTKPFTVRNLSSTIEQLIV